MRQFGLAVEDLKQTFSKYQLWIHLGCIEVKQRYRRSVLGPWWISLSLLIFIMMMGVVFSRLFHENINEYIPFFTAGFLFWTFISSSVVESSDIFKTNAGFIKQVNLPFNIYLFKFLVRQLIILGHNLVVYLLVCGFFKFNPGSKVLMIIPGFLLLLANVYWVCLLVGVLCSRYRDLVPMISSCVQIAFFVTPISWMPKLLDQNPGILKFNPLTYLLDIVRSPLLGTEPSMISWYVCFGMAVIGFFISFLLFSQMRSRIAFWVD